VTEPEPKKPNFLRRLYAWTQGWATHRSATLALFLISVAESSFFPIPPDVLLIALCGAQPKRALWFALVCTVGSVLGGMLGYLIGYSLMGFGEWLLSFFASQETIEHVKQLYQENAFLAVLGAAFTPIPYKVFTITGGFAAINFWVFVAASIVGRGGRFFLVSGLIYFVGPKIQPTVEKYLEWFTLALFALLVAGFICLKLLAS
jgi:membrane protein YqaA with SNARE-associated domain